MKKVLFVVIFLLTYCNSSDPSENSSLSDTQVAAQVPCHKNLYTLTLYDESHHLQFEKSVNEVVDQIASSQCLKILFEQNKLRHKIKSLTHLTYTSDPPYIQVTLKSVNMPEAPLFIIDPKAFQIQGFIPYKGKNFYYYFSDAKVTKIDDLTSYDLGYNSTYDNEDGIALPKNLTINTRSLKNSLKNIGEFNGSNPQIIQNDLLIALTLTLESLKFGQLAVDIESIFKKNNSVNWSHFYETYFKHWSDESRNFYKNKKDWVIKNSLIIQSKRIPIGLDPKDIPDPQKEQKANTSQLKAENSNKDALKKNSIPSIN